MKIAILTDIHLGKDLTNPAINEESTRVASSLVFSRLPALLDHISSWHQPELWINLGDVIRSETVEIDKKNYQQGLEILQQSCQPIIHLLGNHEIRQLTNQDILDIWKDLSIEQSEYGSQVFQGVRFIWLGLETRMVEGNKRTFLPQNQLQWLATELEHSIQPAVLLSHYAFNHQNFTGNYYFETLGKNFACYENQQEVQEIIREFQSKILLTVNGHVHWIQVNVGSQPPQFTLPSMTENIAAPGEKVFPAIYSILEINEGHFSLKSYSDRFCLWSVEG